MVKEFIKKIEQNNFVKKYGSIILFFSIILLLLALPYYFFGGKLFLGGDDSRLFYAYPKEYLINAQFFSWSNLSSVGWSYPYHDFLPFVLLWSALSFVLSPMILDYLAFSLPLVLGFYYFQKMIKELILTGKDKFNLEIILGSVFYVFSPILIQNHYLNPLIPIWLIGLFPAIMTYLLRFLKTGKLSNILWTVLLTTFFSFGFHNIPWIAGFLLPVVLSLIICLFMFKLSEIMYYSKRFFVFVAIITFSQFFWLIPALATLIGPRSSSVASKVVTSDFTNDFARAIIGTAKGTVIYPLLNLYHRQIAFDFNWYLKNIFLNFYDKTYFLNSIYIFILFMGIMNFRKHLNTTERKIFIIIMVAFTLSLYFFTVNIGPLLNLFILFGKIPGFVLFRNPYDKFALGYVLIYSTLISFCLIILSRKFKKVSLYYLILLPFIIGTIINSSQTQNIIVSPLWTTKDIYKFSTIPSEYFKFMNYIHENISPTNNILNVPYGLSLYSIVKDVDSNNAYVGISPVVVFSGVNDISGFLSFNYQPDGDRMTEAILNKDYNTINKILYSHNINYVMVTNNIPKEVKKSFIYAQDVLASEDTKFLENITSKKLANSSKGNYVLYSTHNKNSLISTQNSQFYRVSRVKYEIYIKNIKAKQSIVFNDSFHPGWKFYLNLANSKFECPEKSTLESGKSECRVQPSIFNINDLQYFYKKPIFDDTHSIFNNFSNSWNIDPTYIKKNFDQKYYAENKDGSINVKLTLYFEPQEYFYIGVFISVLVFVILTVTVVKKNEKET